ncbi:hypothetical protein HNR46_004003 [Haloferula luteola]|uniref:Uncharacterized protein n=1 Tax=Haloferula luteola TaxID=595692 RepID=A0A840V6Y9_9BACT|nr:hypothetical protein [Haloferula luteola]MBB5353742.1 hypothetical protein [Haloferula luteola]
MTSRLYEVASDGEHREVPIRLPHVTYDDGLKGFITRWSWAGNDVLVGHAEITDGAGDEIIEERIYVFHMQEQALARLDLSALNLSDTASLEIASIGEDLEHLRVRLGDREFAVKADLKSPPRLLERPDPAPTSNMQAIGQQTPASARSTKQKPAPITTVEESPSSTRWPLVVVVAALGLLWVLLKKRKSKGSVLNGA